MSPISVDYSLLVDGAAATADSAKTPMIDEETALEEMLSGDIDFGSVGFATGTTISIAADGSILPVRNFHRLNTYLGIGADEVTNINGNFLNFVVIRTAQANQEITFRHGVGNIFFMNGRDLTIRSTTASILLWRPTGVDLWFAESLPPQIFDPQLLETVTIATGAITINTSWVRINPESGTVDDLVTINNPKGIGIAFLMLNDASDSITAVPETGNIKILNDESAVMNNKSFVFLAIWNATSSKWHVLKPVILGLRELAEIAGISMRGKVFLTSPPVLLNDSFLDFKSNQKNMNMGFFVDSAGAPKEIPGTSISYFNTNQGVLQFTQWGNFKRWTFVNQIASLGVFVFNANRRFNTDQFAYMAMRAIISTPEYTQFGLCYTSGLPIVGNTFAPASIFCRPLGSSLALDLNIWTSSFGNPGSSTRSNLETIIGHATPGEQLVLRLWLDYLGNRVFYKVNNDPIGSTFVDSAAWNRFTAVSDHHLDVFVCSIATNVNADAELSLAQCYVEAY